jgi:hypothetical protein
MTTKEQLEKWLNGKSIHNNNNLYSIIDGFGDKEGPFKLEGGECCPDFSCCGGELASIEERQIFYKAFLEEDQDTMHEMYLMWLDSYLHKSFPNLVLHIDKERKLKV